MPSKRPLRIGFVSDGVYPFNKGGKERRLWEISRRLPSLGAEVHIFTMKWWEGGKTLDIDGVHLHAICKRRSMYDDERRSIMQALMFGLATLKLIFVRFDVLDVDHIPYFPLFAGRLVCILRRKRMVATWHEVWGRNYWYKYLGRLAPISALTEWLAARTPTAIIAVSKQTSDRLVSELGVTAPIHVIELGVDIAAIRDEKESILSCDILFAGRLLAHKQVDLLLRAVALMRESRPDISCCIVGEGPERSRLESLSRELDLEANVTFYDFLNGSEIYGLMKSATVFALPSVREGFGAVVLEANSCGLPVVTVDHPDNAARHLITEGQNGFIASVTSPSLADMLALALRRATLMDPQACAERSGFLRDWDDIAAAVFNAITAAKPPTKQPSGRNFDAAYRAKDPT